MVKKLRNEKKQQNIITIVSIIFLMLGWGVGGKEKNCVHSLVYHL